MEQKNAGTKYNIATNNCLTFAEELALRINQQSAEDGPYEGVKALRVLTADHGTSYYTISEAEKGLAILHDEDTASQLTSPFIDIRMRHYPSDERDRDPWPPKPESHWKPSGVYGESYRNELQPDWISLSPASPDQGNFTQSSASEDIVRDNWIETETETENDKTSNYDGNPWRFENPF